MSNMDWNELKIPLGTAVDLFKQYKLRQEKPQYDAQFQELHESLHKFWVESLPLKETGLSNAHYQCDLRFAISLYDHLDSIGFTQWEAADDEIWAGFALKVIPDIYYDRWPFNGKDDHFQRWIYFRTWRVWTKTLWWFIFLTMATDANGKLDKDATWDRLCDLESTSIDDFLDRCGKGFRVEFGRKLMERFVQFIRAHNITGTSRRTTWRFIVSQAYLRSINIDPDLCGHESFLDDIFKLFEQQNSNIKE